MQRNSVRRPINEAAVQAALWDESPTFVVLHNAYWYWFDAWLRCLVVRELAELRGRPSGIDRTVTVGSPGSELTARAAASPYASIFGAFVLQRQVHIYAKDSAKPGFLMAAHT